MTQSETAQALVESLKQLDNGLGPLVKLCCPIGKTKDQLPEFCLVAKHLPLLRDVFRDIFQSLSSVDEEKESLELNSQNCLVIRQAVEGLDSQITYIQELFNAVKESQNKVEDYRRAVRNGNGKRLEVVMADILKPATDPAVHPFVAEYRTELLQSALREFETFNSSLETESRKGVTTLNNFGAGSQLYHGGSGNINKCDGGLQINGQNKDAKYYYGTTANKED
ncbi:uncharacterized protein NECHADRAFT_78332 [Fusarium vanettenii 77-13-4]|uniref:NACHT-NTPase and P-loop NTPases N-terminal domain-containing protein n=1 Tax=Fusarium vanettenii (strain ATCC MYA-4622 / CBS 123669 / FGSC 9596 / NRRL 45880 / 77-13-4) TaxID=660122 RepID=C7ZFI1_FUSV7|nr:uncharacterized protein NECHADRAFT_78332 [Fusarium vanettenii 77-13-4]EEU37155.1 predicted protein [Fusarium vanettenii 77-13-4]